MSGVLPLLTETVATSIFISTESAKILANQFKASPWEFWLPLTTSFLAVIAAFLSYAAAEKSASTASTTLRLSHQLFINDLSKEHDFLFRQMAEEREESNSKIFSLKTKISACNFLEKLCAFFYKGTINEMELLAYIGLLTNKQLMQHSESSRMLGQYKKWQSQNRKIIAETQELRKG
ncbi:MAG: hypothetical protein WC686_01295 [Candidatus Shapirobacteria bacterium]|jgi:hypothetical protein